MSRFGEPWQIVDLDGGEWGLYSDDEHLVVGRLLTGRASACVNALAGIPDPSSYRAAVDALREAAEAVKRDAWKYEHTDNALSHEARMRWSVFTNLCAALARLESGEGD